MTPFMLFNLQFTLSLAVFALIAHWYIQPRLARLPRERALLPLLLIHVFRYTPLTLLVPGQVALSVPAAAARTIAFGDLLSGLLAFVAVLLVRYGSAAGTGAAWLFSVVGIGDIVLAVRVGLTARLYEHALGFNWYILNYYVPVLCVTHVMIVILLLRRRHPE